KSDAPRLTSGRTLASMAGRAGGRHSLRKADVRQFLLAAPLSLEPGDIAELEAQVGEGHRIDVEVGATVIEVKRDLRKGQSSGGGQKAARGLRREATRCHRRSVCWHPH